ncbi:MAG TPA: FAD:protein FMN transferase [Candidatus Borkfalkia excrementipullorum]|nr:FAD:protein FMN transferase [Candidatus Borkfalkia excrementipullorum]
MERKKGILLVSLAAAFLVALICVAAVFFPQGGSGGNAYFVEFGLSDDFYVDGEPISGSERTSLLDEIGALLKEIEDEVSVEKSGSDIARLNAAQAGEEVSVGGHTYAMLRLCKNLYEETGGAFTPALYALSELWGFSPAYEGHYTDSRPEPGEEEIAAALAVSDFENIELRENNVVVKTDGGTKLDLGGIAKGYMSDAAAALVRGKYPGQQLDGILTVMSNSILFGQKRDESAEGGVRGYTMQIDNPRSLTTASGRAAVGVNLTDVAVSTSADTYRFYVWEDKIYKHILDPHTGKPSDNGVISVTALVPLTEGAAYAGAFADALSTAGFCMPLQDALAFYGDMAQKYGVGAVVITSDFRYYVVGNYGILDPSDYSAGDTDVFTRAEVSEAPARVEPCAEERKYIEYVAGLSE